MELVTGRTGFAHVTSQQARNLNKGIWGNTSYIFPVGKKMEVTVKTANQITVADGVLMAQGAQFEIQSGTVETLDIANGKSGYTRIDLACIKYQKIDDVETADTWEILKGTEVANAKTPAWPTDARINAVIGSDTEVLIPVVEITVKDLAIQSANLIPGRISLASDLNKRDDDLEDSMIKNFLQFNENVKTITPVLLDSQTRYLDANLIIGNLISKLTGKDTVNIWLNYQGNTSIKKIPLRAGKYVLREFNISDAFGTSLKILEVETTIKDNGAAYSLEFTAGRVWGWSGKSTSNATWNECEKSDACCIKRIWLTREFA